MRKRCPRCGCALAYQSNIDDGLWWCESCKADVKPNEG